MGCHLWGRTESDTTRLKRLSSSSSPPGSSVHGILQARTLDGLPCPPAGDLPEPEIKPACPASPALQADSSPTEPPGKPLLLKKSPKFLQFPLSLFRSRVPVRTPHYTWCSCLLMLFSAVAALRLALLLTTLMVLKGAGWERQRMSLNFDVSDVFVMIVLGLPVWGKKTTVVRDLLVVQWLNLHLPMQGVQVQSLAGDLKSQMPLWTEKMKHNTEIIL